MLFIKDGRPIENHRWSNTSDSDRIIKEKIKKKMFNDCYVRWIKTSAVYAFFTPVTLLTHDMI